MKKIKAFFAKPVVKTQVWRAFRLFAFTFASLMGAEPSHWSFAAAMAAIVAAAEVVFRAFVPPAV